MGNCTASIKKAGVTGDLRYVAADVTLSNSYATGGDSLTADILGIKAGTVLLLIAAPKTGLVFEYDHTNKLLKAFYPTGGSAAAPTTATAVPKSASGASTASAVDATQPNLIAGVGKEVGNTADLSTIVTRVLAWIVDV